MAGTDYTGIGSAVHVDCERSQNTSGSKQFVAAASITLWGQSETTHGGRCKNIKGAK